jgi:hypothetical protein
MGLRIYGEMLKLPELAKKLQTLPNLFRFTLSLQNYIFSDERKK